jgi:hypothetical protein
MVKAPLLSHAGEELDGVRGQWHDGGKHPECQLPDLVRAHLRNGLGSQNPHAVKLATA